MIPREACEDLVGVCEDLKTPHEGYVSMGTCAMDATQSVERKRTNTTSLAGVSRTRESLNEAQLIVSNMDRFLSPAERRTRRAYKSAMSSVLDPEEPVSRMQRLVEHPAFDGMSLFVNVCNLVMLGLSVQGAAAHFSLISSFVCSLLFLIELCLRIAGHGRFFFSSTNDNRNWNIFDVAVVGYSIVEFVVYSAYSQSNMSCQVYLGSVMKTIKMVRVIKVVRLFRFFRELAILVMMVRDSVKPWGWSLFMLVVIIYVFAIFFTQNAVKWLEEANTCKGASVGEASDVERYFGSIPRSVYSLVQAMLGGVSWGVLSDLLLLDMQDPLSAAVFFFYLAFTILVALNIITGACVDAAVETSRVHRRLLSEEELRLKEEYAKQMLARFGALDDDTTATLNYAEFHEYTQDPRVQAYLCALGLDSSDLKRLFGLLDADNSGDIDPREFLDGCLRLKGHARSMDVYSIMRDLKLLGGRVEALCQAVDKL
jgi:hypothetical protein